MYYNVLKISGNFMTLLTEVLQTHVCADFNFRLKIWDILK